MKKQLLIFSVLVLTTFHLFGQSISGGAGIIHVTGDPDDISLAQDVDEHESNIAYDPTNQMVYFFNPSGTAGVNQWEGVSVTSFANSDTRLTNPTVSDGNLVFDILNVVTGNTTGATVSIPILSIAPVQNVVGGGDISVTDDGSGTYTVSFSETNTSLTISGSTLTYTDEEGTVNNLDLPSVDGSETSVTGGGDISVSGTGTSADPYTISFTESTSTLTISGSTLTFTDENGDETNIDLGTLQHEAVTVNDGNTIDFTASGTDNQTITAEITGAASATEGTVPTSDGSGNITWSAPTVEEYIQSMDADANGRLVATLLSGETFKVDLNSAPRVKNMSELETAAAALNSGETGLVVADDGNSLGLAAKESASVEVGVLFFIKKK